MANPLDEVTQDQSQDDAGNPLRRVYIYGSDAPGDGSPFQPQTINSPLTAAVAPPQDDIATLIAKVKDRLLGTGGQERYQTWPERMVREGLSAPGDVLARTEPSTTDSLIEPALATSALASGSTLFNPKGAATLGSGLTRPGASAVAAEPAPIFYSALEHATTNAAQDTMSPQQWLGYLKNQPGVKAEELAWTGLPDWLAQQKGKVTKEDVKSYLDEHKVEIKDVTKTSLDDPRKLAEEELRSAYGEEDWRSFDHEEQQSRIDEHMEGLEGEHAPEGSTKYSSYQLPGGENYREHLLTMPHDASLDVPGGPVGAANYKSSHWDEPNVLAHVRTNDRTMEGGRQWRIRNNKSGNSAGPFNSEAEANASLSTFPDGLRPNLEVIPAGTRPLKSLHIEEIQSDWHQQGRKQGYKIDKSKLNSEFERIMGRKPKDEADFKEFLEEYNAQGGKVGVPDAPFKTTWPELALKRMIRHAAENGYDRISWTPGEAQAARYDLSKTISRIEHHEFPGSGQKGITAYDLKGNKVIDKYVKDEELPDVIGKEAAEKLLKAKPTEKPDTSKWKATRNEGDSDWSVHDENGKLLNSFRVDAPDAQRAVKAVVAKTPVGSRVLEGLDLKVGGEGMREFYDKMLPKMAEKIGKAHGVKVKVGKIKTPNPDGGWMSGEKAMQLLGDDPAWRIPQGEEARSTWYRSLAVKDRDNLVAAARKLSKEMTSDHPVHYFDLPQSLRDHAVGKGFPLYMSGLPFPLTPVDHDPFEKKK